MISVIVIGKNEETRLGSCMQSIKDAMGVMLHEVLYVDSRSTDQSVAIAGRWGARCYVLSDPNTTAGLGRLVGTQEAQGEYLLFLDADMQLRRGFLESAMMTMAREGYDGATGIRDDVYMKDGKVDIDSLEAIAFDPYTHGYYKVGGRVGDAFKDGLKLK